MSHSVQIQGTEQAGPLAERLRTAALKTLQHQQAPPGDLTVVLVDAAQIRDLNRRFRSIDAETDVLSFPDGTVDPDCRRTYFGDVIIALPVAEAQAQGAGHPPEDELALLTVHGTLHLLGLDHEQPDEKSRMWQAQAEILQALGCRASLPEGRWR